MASIVWDWLHFHQDCVVCFPSHHYQWELFLTKLKHIIQSAPLTLWWAGLKASLQPPCCCQIFLNEPDKYTFAGGKTWPIYNRKPRSFSPVSRPFKNNTHQVSLCNQLSNMAKTVCCWREEIRCVQRLWCASPSKALALWIVVPWRLKKG